MELIVMESKSRSGGRSSCNSKSASLGGIFTPCQHSWLCNAERCISHGRFCLTDRLSHAGIMPKQLQLRSCRLHWRIAPWLVSWRLTSARNFKGNRERGCRMREG